MACKPRLSPLVVLLLYHMIAMSTLVVPALLLLLLPRQVKRHLGVEAIRLWRVGYKGNGCRLGISLTREKASRQHVLALKVSMQAVIGGCGYATVVPIVSQARI